MTDVEKIRELIEEIYPAKSLGDYGLKEMLALKVMEWKEEDMIKKVVDFLRRVCETEDSKYVLFDTEEGHCGIDNKLIEDFKHYLLKNTK